MNERIDAAQVGDVGGLFQRFLADGAHVNVFDRRMRQLLRVIERGQLVEALVGNFGHSYMSFARIRKSWSGKIRLGQYAEQRCLAHLRQADNSSFHESVLGSLLSVLSLRFLLIGRPRVEFLGGPAGTS